MIITNALTGKTTDFHWEHTSGDGKSYMMLPDHTKIKCQLISHDGTFIKADGTEGTEEVWCKVCDQRCFYSDILYCVIPLKCINDDNKYSHKDFKSTRASLISYPLSNIVEIPTAQPVEENEVPSINIPVVEATPI